MIHRIFILTALSFTGCGGSGGGGLPVPVTVVIPSTVARDGYLRSDGAVETASGDLIVGDMEFNIPLGSSRGVVGFDLVGNGIPPGATIQTALLTLQQVASAGNPYADLGNLLVDHVDFGAAIDATDFSGSTLLAGFGVFSTDTAPGVRSLEVGARVQADLTAGRTVSDFRLRFAADFDSDRNHDLVHFIDTENTIGLGQSPRLTVTYLP